MRNRQIYQSDVLILNDGTTSPDSAISTGEMVQLTRVQDGSFGFQISRESVNQWGQGGRIDSLVLNSPDVTADFTYLLSNFRNEVNLGFHLSNDFSESFTKRLLSTSETGVGNISAAAQSGRNYTILTCDEGNDANIGGFPLGAGATSLSIGKAYLTDYSIEAAVGSIPTASFSIKGSNLKGQNQSVPSGQVLLVDSPFADEGGESANKISVDVSATSPLLTPQTGSSEFLPSALRPGDITLDLGDAAVLTDLLDASPGTAAHIQSFSMNIPFSRSSLERLGNNFAYAEAVDFPIEVTINISAIVADLKAAGSVYDELINGTKSNIGITFNNKAGNPVMKYIIKGCENESESFSQSIGSNKTVDMVFSAQIGGPLDLNAGVFASGKTISA
tara:strand:+ start:1506 stop:2675 length:1170 start_codon:yes stop_codon:yes gene_type:complete